METLYSIGMVLFWLLVRLGLPLALTLLLVMLLRKLDARWRQEGAAVAPILARNTGCWEVHRCSAEKRAACQAYAHPETPCWQVFRSEEGLLRETCLGCDVFRNAPLSVSKQGYNCPGKVIYEKKRA